ncbi:MAG TPA: four helix bundle protein [Steroidobacteraceae bacterium]|nr:four helix bundle protein [Steroidobacteraceae bacterium]
MRGPLTHKDLDVWKRALCLAELTYRVSRSFPSEERFGLTIQMRRASVSILRNISEGAARRARAEYVHFLHIARGSLAELDAQSSLAARLNFGAGVMHGLQEEIDRVGKLLGAQISALKRE